MQKVVLKLDFFDEKIKQKAMKNVSSLAGVDSVAVDMKDKKLTVTGDVDPVTVVSKLRKLCHTQIVSVGPAKEPEKKKEDGGGGGDNKKEDDKKKAGDKNKKPSSDSKDDALKFAYSVPAYHHPYPYFNYQQQHQPYYNYDHPPTPYYSKVVHDESPNCVIC